MAKFVTVQGTTSQIIHLFVPNSAATDGSGKTGITHSAAGFLMSYIRPGDATHSLVTLTGSGLNVGTYVSGAWIEVNSGTMPGIYEFHVPNAAVTTGASRVVFYAGGAASMAPTPFEIEMYPANGLFTPILAATTHSGATIPNISTCATVTRALLVDTVSTVARALLVDTATRVLLADTVSTAARVLLVDTASVALTCATVTRALLVDTVSTVARALLVDTVSTVARVILVDTVSSATLSNGQIVIRKNSALSNFAFLMTDTATHGPMTGLTVTGQRSLNGGAFAACTNAPAEVASGMYKVDLEAGDLNANVVTFKFNAANADTRFITVYPQP